MWRSRKESIEENKGKILMEDVDPRRIFKFIFLQNIETLTEFDHAVIKAAASVPCLSAQSASLSGHILFLHP